MSGLPPGPVLVLGTGRAGCSAAAALSRAAPAVTVWDAFDGPETWRRRDELRAGGVRVQLGPWRDDLLAGVATVVKSPGIPKDAAPVRAAQARGLTVVDELELGVRLSRRELVAVTGTDGKSTVSHLVASALAAGGADVPIAGNTEFGPPLASVPPRGGPVVVEASSYQLEFTTPAFGRLAVLTNLTPEHLHRHGTLYAYGQAKRRLFLGAGRVVPLAVVNADDAFGRALAADATVAGAAVATFGSTSVAGYRALEVRSALSGATVRARTPGGELVLRTRLPGRHNAENALAALAACDLLGVPRPVAVSAIESFPGVPGRWERVGEAPFDVVVDFAHTPAALRAVLTTARELVAERPGAQLHLVLSASGRTTPGKRGPLGAVGAELADRVVVTEAGLGGEPREHVIATIVAGTEGGAAEVEIVPDRREAIRQALLGTRPGDFVLVNDRGVRPLFITDPAGGGHPWDDRAVVRDELAAILDTMTA